MMHTRDARGAIARLLEFGVSRQEIEQTLVAVTAKAGGIDLPFL